MMFFGEGVIEYLEISKEKHPKINSVNYLCNQNTGHKKTRIHHQHLISGRGTTGTAPQIYGFYGILNQFNFIYVQKN